MSLGTAKELALKTFSEWSNDNVQRLSASLSFYTMLSLAPLLMIVVAIAGLVFGREAAQGEIVEQMRGLMGEQGAEAMQTVIQNAQEVGTGVVALIVGGVVLLFGASAVFGELQSALNAIWDVKTRPDAGWGELIKDRFFSFLMVLGTGFLLLVSLVLSAGMSAAGKYFGSLLPMPAWLLQSVQWLVVLAVVTGLLALIFKYVPDVKVAWSDVWVGAFSSAILFSIGKFAIGLYLGRSTFASAYGAAASLVVLMVWVYYASQIVFLGAEFTQVYANRYGSGMRPEDEAVFAGRKDQSRQAGQQGERLKPEAHATPKPKLAQRPAAMPGFRVIRPSPVATRPRTGSPVGTPVPGPLVAPPGDPRPAATTAPARPGRRLSRKERWVSLAGLGGLLSGMFISAVRRRKSHATGPIRALDSASRALRRAANRLRAS